MQESDNNKKIGPITIVNYTGIAASKEYPAIVRQTARQITEVGYIVVGEWLEELHESDLIALIQANDASAFTGVLDDSIAMLTIMLYAAEGNEPPSTDEFTKALSCFVIFLGAEMMARRGIIDFVRKHATLSGDGLDKELVSLKSFLPPSEGTQDV